MSSPPHLVLLGDSIFDNLAYTAGAPDVVSHLRATLPAGWGATLCAVDGSTTADLPDQLSKVPDEASHLIVSIGGNDALLNSDLLDSPVHSTAEGLDLFDERVQRFETSYHKAMEAVSSLGKELVICTIYNGNMEPKEARRARIALMMFNDVILRTAFERRLSVLDLRAVCSEPSDYANPIEPSGTGGRKIAEAIARICGATETPGLSRVYVG